MAPGVAWEKHLTQLLPVHPLNSVLGTRKCQSLPGPNYRPSVAMMSIP